MAKWVKPRELADTFMNSRPGHWSTLSYLQYLFFYYISFYQRRLIEFVFHLKAVENWRLRDFRKRRLLVRDERVGDVGIFRIFNDIGTEGQHRN